MKDWRVMEENLYCMHYVRKKYFPIHNLISSNLSKNKNGRIDNCEPGEWTN